MGKRTTGNSLFGRNYTDALPSTWANQQLGLITQTYLANHIKASFSKFRFDPTRQHAAQTSNEDDNDDEGTGSFSMDPSMTTFIMTTYMDCKKWLDSDVLDSDSISPNLQATPKRNPRSTGRPQEAASGSTFNAG